MHIQKFEGMLEAVAIGSLDHVDKIFQSCCAFHNYLLDINGLDEEWEKGVCGFTIAIIMTITG